MTMSPKDRQAWLEAWVRLHKRADVLDDAFVRAYIKATDVPWRETMWGAPKCPTLGRDLAALAAQGRLNRYRVGMSNWQPGFPKWVWSYEIPGSI